MLKRATSTWKLGRQPHVCVVGAGVSGLRCADLLLQSGMRVTVLEARDRVGGRVHQSDHLGYPVDMGANWIHGGTDDNPIKILAKETGTTVVANDDHSTVFDERGKVIDHARATELSEVVWGIIGDAFKYSNEASDIPVDRSLKDYFVDELEKKDLTAEDKKIVLQMSEMWGGYIGTPYSRQSLKYFWLEASIEGENLFVASTYRAILRRIARPARSAAEMHLSTVVSSVSTDPDSDSVHITTSTLPTSLSFDAAIITIPLGCLRHDSVTFHPPLSPSLTHAITSISYGTLEKVYISFPSAFWNSSDDKFPFFSHYLHPLYAPHNPSSQDVGMISLSTAPANTAHPTLLFYVYGPLGAYVTSLITSLCPKDAEYRRRLIDFFAPYYSLLPGYSAQSDACRPSAVLATDWQHDALAGYGSYTNWQIDTSAEDGTAPKMALDRAIEALREGIPDRKIWFAGEHTAPFRGLGTVTGAYWSGDGVAARVRKSFEREEERAGKGGGDEGWEMVDHPVEEKEREREKGKTSAQVGKGMKDGSGGVEI